MRRQAIALSPLTAIKMEVWSDQPGLQFFCGAAMKKKVTSKNGNAYGKRAAFCFETQGYPNSVNQPKFPDILAPAKETYQTCTAFKFSKGENDKVV